jgi:hypothetical protein
LNFVSAEYFGGGEEGDGRDLVGVAAMKPTHAENPDFDRVWRPWRWTDDPELRVPDRGACAAKLLAKKKREEIKFRLLLLDRREEEKERRRRRRRNR